MIIKIDPDKQKALSLKQNALITHSRLNEIDKLKYPSNTLLDYYDIIRSFMEALVALEGVKIKGEGAHYELINYVSEKYKFSEGNKQFLQNLRQFRNRISYEGFSVNLNYINENCERIEEIIKELKGLLNSGIEKL